MQQCLLLSLLTVGRRRRAEAWLTSRDHLGRGGGGQGECQGGYTKRYTNRGDRGVIGLVGERWSLPRFQAGLLITLFGHMKACYICIPFDMSNISQVIRPLCLHVSLMMLDGKPEIIPFSCAHTGIGSITLEDFTQ